MPRKPDVKIGTAIPHGLKPHPLSERLYGRLDHDSEHFKTLRDSVRQHGILEPLVITRDDVIVSGHSRHQIALLLNLDEVPVVVVKPADDLALEEMLIHSNRQREKTPEQKAREFKELKRIEAERAKARQAHGKTAPGKTLRENLPEAYNPLDPYEAAAWDDKCLITEAPHPESNRARDKAAAAVGWSGRTAEKAVAVVDAIDEAEESGDHDRAEELLEALNKSVSAGINAAKPKGSQQESRLETVNCQGDEQESNAIIDLAGLAQVQSAIKLWNNGTKRALYEWLASQL